MSKSLDDIQFYNQNGISKTLLDFLFPINNSHYIQFNGELEPAEKFGGTWELDDEYKGRFLIGAGGKYELGAIGGEETHTLTISEMPDHSHGIVTSRDNLNPSKRMVASIGDGTNDYLGTYSVGNNEAHNNMPPYIGVNFWKRIG